MVGVDGATVVLSQDAVISSNGWGGMNARLGAAIVLFGGPTVEGNGRADPTMVSNFLFPRFRSGISVYSGSKLSVFPVVLPNGEEKIPQIIGNS